MSLIVAVKDKNRYVLGADKQNSAGGNKDHNATKIWEVSNCPGIIMGGVGSCRATQIIQYSDIIDLNCLARGCTTEYVVHSLVPEIVSALEMNGISCSVSSEDKTRMIPNSFLFAVDDKAWVIWNDLSVIEINDYFAIGSGSDVAIGALFATKHKNPFERIVTCIDAASETTLFVDDGIDLLATNLEKEDVSMMAKALGVSEKDILGEEPELKEIVNKTDSKKKVEEEKAPSAKKTTKTKKTTEK